MQFYGFERDSRGTYQLLYEGQPEQYCGESARPIKYVLLSDIHSLEAIGPPRKQRLQLMQFSDGRQRVITSLETLAEGSAYLFGISVLTVIGTGIAGFVFPPAWGYTVGAAWTGLGALGTGIAAAEFSDRLYTVKAVDFEVLTVNFGCTSTSSPELAGISLIGVVPVSDFNKMRTQLECLQRNAQADEDDEGFAVDFAMDTP